MIKKRYIYRFLALGLFFNNLLIFSNAHSMEIPDRYQTLEGEYITIDDSIEDELYEIDIFGNTVQNENNLEDIQSVGDLYVDDEGNPILDSKGRKQYKIDIVSINQNLFDEEWIKHPTITYTDKIQSKNYIKVSDKFTYVSNNMNIWYQEFGYRSLIIQCYDKDLNHLGQVLVYVNAYNPFTLLEGTEYIKFDLDGTVDNLDKIYCQLNIGNVLSEYKSQKKHKVTILLPTQLQKVGDLADRLYWDNEKGRYVIEKNIHSFITNSNADVIANSANILHTIGLTNTGKEFNSTTSTGVGKYDCIYIAGCKNSYWNSSANLLDKDKVYIASYTKNDYKVVRVYRSVDTLITDDKVNEYFRNKLCLFRMNPEYIETNITSKIKIPIYEGKTHIYAETENGIIPYLKVTVDRLFEVAKSAIEEAKLNPTIENISLSRMYINMLSESIHKDQLHDELNEVFNTDIKLDKKTISSSVDVYIKFDNSISMALSTNSITFEDLSGVDDVEMQNAVEILVSSSLPYQLNSYLVDEIYNSDKTKKIDIDRLEIKDGKANTYKPFVSINNKVVLEDNCESGNNLSHNIDLKFYGSNAYESDIYKTVIKFEAEQK